MTFARALPAHATISRAWLAAVATTVFAALIFSAAVGRPAAATTAKIAAPPATAAVTSEEPWTPSTMFFGGSEFSVPTEHRLPIDLDALDPNCMCIGYY